MDADPSPQGVKVARRNTIKNAKTPADALMKALEGLEHIQDPAGRRRYAQEVLGIGDAARLTDGSLGKLKDQIIRFRREQGILSPEDLKRAEEFDERLTTLRGSLMRLGESIARDLMPQATQMVEWLDGIVKNNREDITAEIRKGLQGLQKAIDEVDWKKFGDDAGTTLRQSATAAAAIKTEVAEIAQFMKAIQDGHYAQAGRMVLGSDNAVMRYVAPMEGDDVKAAQEDVDGKKLVRDAAREAQGYWFGRMQQKWGGLPTADQAEKDLADAEAKLKRLQSRTPDQARSDAAIAEIEGKLASKQGELAYQQRRSPVRDENNIRVLTEEIERLTAEMRRLRETQGSQSRDGATLQKQSFDDTGGSFGGARVQMASLGGAQSAARVGRMLSQRDGGIYLPDGGSGLPGGSGPYLRPDGPGAGIGRSLRGFGGRGGTGGPGRGSPMPPIRPRDGGPGEEVGRALRGETPRGTGRGNRGAARTGQMMAWAMDQLRREGVPEDKLRESAAHLVGQAQMESGLDPNKVHDQGTGYGIYGARDPGGRGLQRRTEMLNWLKKSGYARNSAEGQMREMAHQAMSGRWKKTRRILMGEGSGDLERDTNTITGEFEAPKVINRRSGAVRNALRVGPQGDGSAQVGDGSFTDYLKDAAKTRKLGTAEDEVEHVPDRTQIHGLNRYLQQPYMTGDQEDSTARKFMGGQQELAREFRPMRNLNLREIKEKYAAPKADGEGFDTVYGNGSTGGRGLGGLDSADTLRKAVRTGMAGATPNTDRMGDGKIDLHVMNPGPNTRVKADAKGPIFREIVHRRGRPMSESDV